MRRLTQIRAQKVKAARKAAVEAQQQYTAILEKYGIYL